MLEEPPARSMPDVEAELVGPHAMGGTPGVSENATTFHGDLAGLGLSP